MKRDVINNLVYQRVVDRIHGKEMNEGVDWEMNGDTANLSVNQDKTDKANLGKNSVDTRVFGSKKDILYGDNSRDNRASNIVERFNAKQHLLTLLKSIIRYIKTEHQSPIYSGYGVDGQTKTAIAKWFDELSEDEILRKCEKLLAKVKKDLAVIGEVYHRAITDKDENRIARYNVVGVEGTDVKCIALFSFSDFNFSDAIKHGSIRQNGNTDELMGISKDERKREGKGLGKIDVKYDGEYSIDDDSVDKNFSLHNVQDGHYKQSYGLGGKDGYTSVNQFLDKSIQYAAYALKKEKVKADFIVAVPSSSTFNHYYATNLSNKLNIEYIKDFFKRNLLNLRNPQGNVADKMREQGFTEEEIMKFNARIRSYFFSEIGGEISKPLSDFLKKNESVFADISVQKNSREKIDSKDIFDCLLVYSFQTIVENLNKKELSEEEDPKNVEKYLVSKLFGISNKLYQKEYDSKRILSECIARIKAKVGIKVFRKVLFDMYKKVMQYSDDLKANGYKMRFSTKKFKITGFHQRYRQFLHDVYVVADEMLSQNKDFLQSRFQDANFLIIDEDMNSGGSLRLAIECLEDKLMNVDEKKIACLVNAYSTSGF